MIVGCGTPPIHHNYGNDSLEVYIIQSGEAVRVQKTSAGSYSGELLALQSQGRDQIFRSLAIQQVKDFCAKKGKTSKLAAAPSFFAHTWGNEKGLFATKTNDEMSFPQMLEWQFTCE